MGLIELVLILCIIGVALYLINTYIPMDSKIKLILNIVVVVAVVIWVLNLFGFFHLGDIKVGK